MPEEAAGGAGPRAPFRAVVPDLEDGDDGEAACGLLLPGGPVVARLDAAGRVELAAAGVVLAAAEAAGTPSGLACVVQENRATPSLVTFDGTPWHGELLGHGTHGDPVVPAGAPRT